MLLLVWLALDSHLPAALSPSIPLREAVHTAWTGDDGVLLPPVYALAVGADGYLWVATVRGMLRFDGRRFTPLGATEALALPRGEAMYLVRSQKNGGFWMASRFEVAFGEVGRIRSFPVFNPALRGSIIGIRGESGGGLWVLFEGVIQSSIAGVSRDGSVRLFGPADGLPPAWINAIAPDAANGLWLATRTGVCHWIPGQPAACEQPFPAAAIAVDSMGGGAVAADTAGSIWLRNPGGRWERGAVLDVPVMRGEMRADRQGNVWAGTRQGLVRLQSGRVEWFTRRDGLSGSVVRWFAQDPEGDLWVATEGGIDRFHDPRVRHLSSLDGLSSDEVLSVTSTRDGAVWVGMYASGLDRVDGQTIRHYGKREGLPHLAVMSLFEDALGRLWAATRRGIAYLDHGRFVVALTDWPMEPYGLGGDAMGRVWAAEVNIGLIPVRAGRAMPTFTSLIPQLIRVKGAADGTLWLGSHTGRIAAERNGRVTEYPPFPGPVRAIYEDRAGSIWVGAGPAVGRFRNGRWTTWAGQDSLFDAPVQGIVEDDRGGLWVVTAKAALRFSKGDLDRVPDGTPRQVAAASYGAADGLRLDPRLGSTSPRVAKAADGRIWICEQASLGILDPATLQTDTVAPPVTIEQISLDGKLLERGADLAFRGRALQIVYTGISLLAPERVRFRYRLRPLGDRWIDAGAIREVTYIDLPPRRYRFEVSACNLDGVCSMAPAALDFRVQPYFYQAPWFLGACAGIVGLCIWGTWQLRLRTLVARFQLVARERARMAREIHDSLLQGFTGVVYQLDAAARQFDSAPAESRQKLDRALDLADQALREAREVLSTMRLTALEDRTLPEALERTCRPLAEAAGAGFALKVKGRVEPLPYDTQAAVFLIGREAVTNAAKHAHAARISMQLAYGRRDVRLAVHDDGAGFDADAALDLSGHWGLRGMQERAQQFKAPFRLDTAPGKGTRIDVTVPR